MQKTFDDLDNSTIWVVTGVSVGFLKQLLQRDNWLSWFLIGTFTNSYELSEYQIGSISPNSLTSISLDSQ